MSCNEAKLRTHPAGDQLLDLPVACSGGGRLTADRRCTPRRAFWRRAGYTACMLRDVRIADYIAAFESSVFARFAETGPWELTNHAREIVEQLVADAGPMFTIRQGVAVHETATVERGAILKGPILVGPHCFIAAGAYVRGGCWLDQRCTLGPGV